VHYIRKRNARMKHVDIKYKLGKKSVMYQAICLLVKANCLKTMMKIIFNEYYYICLQPAGGEGLLILLPELLF
jgi:hypothetical protein